LAAAAELSWEAALVWLDDRADYGEVRMVALAEKAIKEDQLEDADT
jgi:hypothetical protein